MQVRAVWRLLLALSAGLVASAAGAQSDQSPLERTIPEVEVTPAEHESRVATPSIPSQADSRIAETFVLSAINIEGATVFSSEELAQNFEPYLASLVSQADLDKIATAITERYRRAGYLLSYAVLPEQSVRSGIVRIRVVEGFVEKVRIEGDRRSAAAVVELGERLAADRPLRSSTLERALGLVRDIPGVLVVDARISRSPGDPARHQLTVSLRTDRIRALTYSDNRGTIEGARLRAYSSLSIASLAVPGDQLRFDLFSIPSSDFRFFYGQAKASLPLGSNGLRISVSGSHGDQFRRLSGPDQHGNSRQLVADLAFPFAESRAFSLIAHASLGDWKSEEERGGTTIQRDRFQVARAWLEFSASSKVRVEGDVGVSRGLDMGPATEAGDLLASRPGAGAKFTKFNGNLRVFAGLSKQVFLRLDASAQYSTEPLLAAEDFALGGSRIGRSFDFNEITGDHGVGGMLEISYRLNSKRVPKSMKFFAFVDGGGAFRKHSLPDFPGEQWLASAGVGTRISAFGLLLRGEIGAPIARSDVDRGLRAFFSITKLY